MSPGVSPRADGSSFVTGHRVQVGIPEPVPGGAQVGAGEWGWGPCARELELGPGDIVPLWIPQEGNEGDFMGEVRAAVGSQLPGGLRHPQTLWASCLAPQDSGQGKLGGRGVNPISGRGVLSLGTPKQHFEVCTGSFGCAWCSALSLTPVSPRRVVMLEKKAEESFGFEIQVGAELG